ncbi:MAG TPA: hypothetical protein VHV74_16860 [Pseudonocardiaceae bacterium]|nr:hypothetical protein [Pseudonocardiaceae bacterium]
MGASSIGGGSFVWAGSLKAGSAQRPLTAEDFSIKDGVVILD